LGIGFRARVSAAQPAGAPLCRTASAAAASSAPSAAWGRPHCQRRRTRTLNPAPPGGAAPTTPPAAACGWRRPGPTEVAEGTRGQPASRARDRQRGCCRWTPAAATGAAAARGRRADPHLEPPLGWPMLPHPAKLDAPSFSFISIGPHRVGCDWYATYCWAIGPCRARHSEAHERMLACAQHCEVCRQHQGKYEAGTRFVPKH